MNRLTVDPTLLLTADTVEAGLVIAAALVCSYVIANIVLLLILRNE